MLFDFDGVLFDSCSDAIEVVDLLRGEDQFAALPSPSAAGHFGELYRGVLRDSLLPFGLDADASKDFFGRHARAMRERAPSIPLFEGVAEGLGRLPRGSYGVITSSFSSVVVDAFSKVGVELDPHNVLGHEVRETKTTKIHSLLKRHGIRADEAIYVGDMESDVIYCRDVPIRCLVTAYGYHPRDLLEATAPLAVCDTPSDLFEVLERGLSIVRM